ncbi:MAG: tetratricopeptide repeat protein, partial [Geminicoccales bacterium]
MTIDPLRLGIGLLVVLIGIAGGPASGQTDSWYEVSKAGLRAAGEGRISEAEQLFREALQLSKDYHDDDPRRATSINNLGYVLHLQGRYAEAEPRYREALELREAALGPDHPDVAQSCNNLAELDRVLGHYDEAEQLHRRALEIREKALGPQ